MATENISKGYISEGWLEEILTKERGFHYDFFGREFDLTKFKTALKKCGIEQINHLKNLGLELHFLPPVTMAQDVDFPGWETKPSEWYYHQVKKGIICRHLGWKRLIPDKEAFRLEGISVFIDIRLKPDYRYGTQMFEEDNLLGPIIKTLRSKKKILRYADGSPSSRFGILCKEWEKWIKAALAGYLGFEISQIRFERGIEFNVIAQLYPHLPRRDDGKTETWVWCEEYCEDWYHRLHAGLASGGGLGEILDENTGYEFDDEGIRPLIVLD